MDSSSASPYLATFPSEYYLEKDDSNIIDLGLSLRALQPEEYYHSTHDNFDILVDWQQLHPESKMAHNFYPVNMKQNGDEQSVRIQNRQRSSYYVKVNMDGLIVGRKICIFDHADYLCLAGRLEYMFGNQTMYGLRLFDDESQFSLFYKDINEQWRIVGDVPWKEFVDCVKRLRIARKDETHQIANLH